ncbi:hypothetical protein GCK32_020634, partial [Trichostrongylus colubriformis]
MLPFRDENVVEMEEPLDTPQQVKEQIVALQVSNKENSAVSESGVFDWATICRSLEEVGKPDGDRASLGQF